MSTEDANKLGIGERVRFSDGALGTVTEKNWTAAKITWDDGQVGIMRLVEMQDVSRVPVAA